MAMFSVGFQLFDMKIASQGKPGQKNQFTRSYLSYGKVQDDAGVQACPVGQQVPVLCGASTFWHKNHLTWQTWPKNSISEDRLELSWHCSGVQGHTNGIIMS